jgi:pyruvate/2-oxoglutarate dehydrogenase complex dihydrolipoamide dehydrogenase (E3) component
MRRLRRARPVPGAVREPRDDHAGPADAREPRRAANRELPAEILDESGIKLLLGRRAEGVRRERGDAVVTLDDGSEARGAAVVVATGRKPRVAGIGLETVGIEAGPRGIDADDRCRAGDGVGAAAA